MTAPGPSWPGDHWTTERGGGGPAILAHRGGWPPSAEPVPHTWENTLAAFAAARSAGADGVELDVRVTADGVVVVHHDAELVGIGPLDAVAYRQLPAWVPTLAAAIDLLGPAALVDVEVKAPPPGSAADVADVAEATVSALPIRPTGAAPWLVTSFWPPALEAARAAAEVQGRADLATGLLLPAALEAEAFVDAAARAGCTVLLPVTPQVTAAVVAHAADAGLAVCPWVVNGTQALAAVVDCGVAAVITDDVATAVTWRHQRLRGG